jgi:hypothetical protein
MFCVLFRCLIYSESKIPIFIKITQTIINNISYGYYLGIPGGKAKDWSLCNDVVNQYSCISLCCHVKLSMQIVFI